MHTDAILPVSFSDSLLGARQASSGKETRGSCVETGLMLIADKPDHTRGKKETRASDGFASIRPIKTKGKDKARPSQRGIKEGCCFNHL